MPLFTFKEVRAKAKEAKGGDRGRTLNKHLNKHLKKDLNKDLKQSSHLPFDKDGKGNTVDEKSKNESTVLLPFTQFLTEVLRKSEPLTGKDTKSPSKSLRQSIKKQNTQVDGKSALKDSIKKQLAIKVPKSFKDT